MGDWFAGLVADYLNATGGTILLFVLLSLSVILSTQFSFGRALTVVGREVKTRAGIVMERWQEWRETKRQDKERKQIIEKQVKKAGRSTPPDIAAKAESAAATLKAVRTKPVKEADDEDEYEEDDDDIDLDDTPVRKAS